MRLELPNQQILLHPPSSFKASHISSKGNNFTLTDPILPSLYLDLAALIIFLLSWVSSISLSLVAPFNELKYTLNF